MFGNGFCWILNWFNKLAGNHVRFSTSNRKYWTAVTRFHARIIFAGGDWNMLNPDTNNTAHRYTCKLLSIDWWYAYQQFSCQHKIQGVQHSRRLNIASKFSCLVCGCSHANSDIRIKLKHKLDCQRIAGTLSYCLISTPSISFIDNTIAGRVCASRFNWITMAISNGKHSSKWQTGQWHWPRPYSNELNYSIKFRRRSSVFTWRFAWISMQPSNWILISLFNMHFISNHGLLLVFFLSIISLFKLNEWNGMHGSLHKYSKRYFCSCVLTRISFLYRKCCRYLPFAPAHPLTINRILFTSRVISWLNIRMKTEEVQCTSVDFNSCRKATIRMNAFDKCIEIHIQQNNPTNHDFMLFFRNFMRYLLRELYVSAQYTRVVWGMSGKNR